MLRWSVDIIRKRAVDDYADDVPVPIDDRESVGQGPATGILQRTQ
jgi:hypothetical protein